MKKFLCACLAMLVLLCGAAMAEHFRCELPVGAWLGLSLYTHLTLPPSGLLWISGVPVTLKK